MAYRLSPPTLDIILAPLAEEEKQRERETKVKKEKGPYGDSNRKTTTHRDTEGETGGKHREK